MKKLATLLLAAGMVLGSFAGVQAIDFKGRGEFQQDFGWADGLGFVRSRPSDASSPSGNDRSRTGPNKRIYGDGVGGVDNFEANQRVRLQLQAIASEDLYGQVNFEIGDFDWGHNGGGKSNGAYGQRPMIMGIRWAFMDFRLPSTDLRMRMGVQRLQMPSYTFSFAPGFSNEGPALLATNKFSDNISLSFFWSRQLNENGPAGAQATKVNQNSKYAAGNMDNWDVFGLLLPLSFDGFKVTPYAILSQMGPRAMNEDGLKGKVVKDPDQRTYSLMYPRWMATSNSKVTSVNKRTGLYADDDYITTYWGAVTGEVTAVDPLRIAWEAMYGEASHVGRGYLNRNGWWINAMVEYKMDWGVPGFYLWYATGDDDNPRNGSERMPMWSQSSGDYPLSFFGFSGSDQNTDLDGYAFNSDPTGTMGLGLRLRDMSFMDKMSHTLRLNLMQGTNSPTMAKYIMGKKALSADYKTSSIADFNAYAGKKGSLYLTEKDQVVEVGFDTSIKLYKELELVVELGYMHLFLDQSKGMWGAGTSAAAAAQGRTNDIRGVNLTDAMKASAMFLYKF